MAMDTSFVPRIASQIAWVELDGEVVILDDAQQAHHLSASGALIWQLIDGVTDIEELVGLISDALGVSAGVVRDDCLDFMEDMVDIGLVSGESGENPESGDA